MTFSDAIEARVDQAIHYEIMDDGDPYVVVTAKASVDGKDYHGQHIVFRNDPAPTWNQALDKGKKEAKAQLLRDAKQGITEQLSSYGCDLQ